jgi:signal transduction histidine kinase
MRLRELLEESRRQTEELQTQQEELRVANEELQDQSAALRAAQAQLEERKEELEVSNSHLIKQRDALEQMQKQLADKADELERASRYKSEFLANMSHELRTPLNSTLILAKLLADNKQGNLNGEQVKFASTIYNAGNDLLALINDILDLSKAEAGKFDLHSEQVSAGELIGECLKLMRGRAMEAKLSLTQSGGPVPRLFADRLRLKQIFLNLLSNAIKFTPAGGAIRVSAEHDNRGRVVVSVSDTGIGIAPEMIQVALEPFRQIASPFSRNAEGTGLGLSLVKALMESHGGSLELDSTLDEGTTARLVFPASRVIQHALLAAV